MDYRELRYGNIVTDRDGSITQISGDITFFEGANYEPVKLTEEWLLKFGFDCGEYFKRLNKFCIKLTYDGYVLMGERYSIGIEIKYVHQLQNLYFALTGEELTIN